MKSPCVSDLQPNELATGVFLVHQKDVRQKKSGEPFLSLVLADRTGDIDAKMWDNVASIMETFGRDDFVKVKGMPQVFQNRLQLTVHTLARVSDSDVEMGDYFPVSRRDPEEMFAELAGVIAGIGNPHIRALLEAIFADAGIAARFRRAPAAKSIHHAWLGGLLEHVLSLCALCKLTGPRYPHIDLDLLLAGAILHDIGKIDELTYERGFGYSDTGQLLGHIVIGLGIVNEKLRGLPEFPAPLRTLVEHMIASHHGELEFGSPKVPLLAEAQMLHYLDNLDSKMETMRAAVEKDKLFGSNWTSYVPSLDRAVLKRDCFLNGTPAPAPHPEPASAPVQARTRVTVLGDKLREALKGD